MAGPNTKVTRNGQVLTQRVWDLIDDIGRRLGKPLRVVQGGFKGTGGGADASGSTHDKGDVYDISDSNLTHDEALWVVNELRKWYGDAWYRAPQYGWPTSAGGSHIHCVQADSYYELSSGAKQQVVAYNNGRNGLSNNARDPHPQPTPRHHYPSASAPGSHSKGASEMFVAEVQYGTNSKSFWLVGPVGAGGKGTTGIGSDEAASWTGPKMKVNDEQTWRRILSRYPQ